MQQQAAARTLDPDHARKLDAYWRAANYLSVGQIYLCDNPLLKEPLTLGGRPAGSPRVEHARGGGADTKFVEGCESCKPAWEAHQDARSAASAASSTLKFYGAELNKRRMELVVETTGFAGLGWEGAEFDKDVLLGTRGWLRSKGNSIEGGTSEIQLNIVAKRVLELPD